MTNEEFEKFIKGDKTNILSLIVADIIGLIFIGFVIYKAYSNYFLL